MCHIDLLREFPKLTCDVSPIVLFVFASRFACKLLFCLLSDFRNGRGCAFHSTRKSWIMAPRGRLSNSVSVEKQLEGQDVEMDSDMYDSDPGSSSREDEGGIERWRASESPKESFSDAEGANEEGEWEYKIIGEEVRHDGTISYVSLPFPCDKD